MEWANTNQLQNHFPLLEKGFPAYSSKDLLFPFPESSYPYQWLETLPFREKNPL